MSSSLEALQSQYSHEAFTLIEQLRASRRPIDTLEARHLATLLLWAAELPAIMHEHGNAHQPLLHPDEVPGSDWESLYAACASQWNQIITTVAAFRTRELLETGLY